MLSLVSVCKLVADIENAFSAFRLRFHVVEIAAFCTCNFVGLSWSLLPKANGGARRPTTSLARRPSSALVGLPGDREENRTMFLNCPGADRGSSVVKHPAMILGELHSWRALRPAMTLHGGQAIAVLQRLFNSFTGLRRSFSSCAFKDPVFLRPGTAWASLPASFL